MHAGEWIHGVNSCWLEVERVLAEESAPQDAPAPKAKAKVRTACTHLLHAH